jgi:hypothetical protein
MGTNQSGGVRRRRESSYEFDYSCIFNRILPRERQLSISHAPISEFILSKKV